MQRFAFSLLLVPLLAACGGAGGEVRSTSPVPKQARKPYLGSVRPPSSNAPPAARVLSLPGLERVIGGTAKELVRQFGPARLDVAEGDARKLQFSGAACVLDVYLYPAARGAEPTATYVDARRPSDGQDVDRVQCVSALRQH